MSDNDEKHVYLLDREALKREHEEQEERRRRIMAQPHHQKCSWCDEKPIRAVAPGFAPNIDEKSWISACKNHVDLLKKVADDYQCKGVSSTVDIIMENDPVAAENLKMLSRAVADHQTGDGTARYAAVDFGVKCDVCGRANLVLVEVPFGHWHLGCAYAIGNGLCTNSVEVSSGEAAALKETKSVILAGQIMSRREKP